MVSVIMPTYNRANCIERAIMSVLNQTYSDLELIIVDDGSTDNTYDIINRIDDTRIRYIRQNNSGACSARNYGIDEAHGEYIAFQDSDDEWYPIKLEKQIEYILSTGCDLVFSSYLRIAENNSCVIPTMLSPNRILVVEDILFNSIIGTPTIFVKRSVAQSIRFDTEMKRVQDWEFSLHAISMGYKIAFQNEVLMKAYESSDSITKSKANSVAEARERIFIKYNSLYKQNRKYLAKSTLMLAQAYRKINREKTRYYLKCSINSKISFENVARLALFSINMW